MQKYACILFSVFVKTTLAKIITQFLALVRCLWKVHIKKSYSASRNLQHLLILYKHVNVARSIGFLLATKSFMASSIQDMGPLYRLASSQEGHWQTSSIYQPWCKVSLTPEWSTHPTGLYPITSSSGVLSCPSLCQVLVRMWSTWTFETLLETD